MGLWKLSLRLVRVEVIREATPLGHIFKNHVHAPLIRSPPAAASDGAGEQEAGIQDIAVSAETHQISFQAQKQQQ